MADENFDILQEFGLNDLPEDKKQALREKILDLIESKFNRAILNAMTDSEKAEFDKVLEKGDGVDEFIKLKVPNFAELHQQIVEDLKAEMLKMDQQVFNK
ncbi:hypothetical protein HN670_03045 [bacterium]|jgi:uncharacterized protein YdcH (DUF465 family)|nr:hypothetical protein [bacterium]